MVMTLKQKLDEIYRIKQEIRTELIAKGYTSEEVGTLLSKVPALIRGLKVDGGGVPPVQTIVDALILHNGRYLKLCNGHYLKLHRNDTASI